ncbi:hypothetical protein FBZ94_10742 [Bradyrhizobium sacchari]|uniref:Uncharacterized protein n=1 Tax=Bradyrhizobium sacchari TaxID=1399419 RepID=A0A560I938_9BRAD|nr:hypothetical protein FBZ94_10742 [Bradyrhizobium sacchari]TWB79165.1 hypothetical protein FBZ95_1031017 [Bradyrhizobium sacchari]
MKWSPGNYGKSLLAFCGQLGKNEFLLIRWFYRRFLLGDPMKEIVELICTDVGTNSPSGFFEPLG